MGRKRHETGPECHARRPEESGLTPAEQPAKAGGLPADATDWAALPGMVPPEPFVRTAWDRVFALVFYGLAYLYVRLVFDRGLLAGGSSAAVFAAVYAALVLAYFVVRGIRPAAFSWLWLAALLSLGLSFALWPNESLLGFDVLALHAVAVYWPLCAAGVTLRPATSSMLPADLLNGLIIVPFGNFFSQLRCLFGGWRLRKAGTGKRLLQILLGAAVLLLLLLAVVPLLMRADDAFARLLERAAALFRVELQLELWPLVAALPVGCFLFGLAYGCVSRRHTGHLQLEKLREWGEDCRVLPPLTVHIVLVGVCVVYTLFVAVTVERCVPPLPDGSPARRSTANLPGKAFLNCAGWRPSTAWCCWG